MALHILKSVDQMIAEREAVIARLQASLDWQVKGVKTGPCVGAEDFAYLIDVLQDCNRAERYNREQHRDQSHIIKMLRENEALKIASQNVLDCTEAAHRPPVRQVLECGGMAGVRIHALADLHEALYGKAIAQAVQPTTKEKP